MSRTTFAIAVLVVAASCDKTPSKAADKREPAPAPAVQPTESHDFAGARFAAPKGSKVGKSDQDTPNTPAIEVSGPGYRVTITKQPLAISFSSYKQAVEMDPSASKIAGTETPPGWDLKHFSTIAINPSGRTIYDHYVQLGGDQYLCRFDDDETSTAVATADAICKSISK